MLEKSTVRDSDSTWRTYSLSRTSGFVERLPQMIDLVSGAMRRLVARLRDVLDRKRTVTPLISDNVVPLLVIDVSRGIAKISTVHASKEAKTIAIVPQVMPSSMMVDKAQEMGGNRSVE